MTHTPKTMLANITARIAALRFTPDDLDALDIAACQMTADLGALVAVDIARTDEGDEEYASLYVDNDSGALLGTVVVVQGGYELMDASGRRVAGIQATQSLPDLLAVLRGMDGPAGA